MELKWTDRAVGDLARLYDFLVEANRPVAERVAQRLTRAPTKLLATPRLGEQLFQFESREVRRIFVARIEIRYEIMADTIYILRLWHTREDR